MTMGETAEKVEVSEVQFFLTETSSDLVIDM